MRLERALEERGLGRWKDETTRVRITRDEFLDIMAELIRGDTELRARQLDLEQLEARRREGATWAVLAMRRAGLLSRKGDELVRAWINASAHELAPDLTAGVVSIIPPSGP